MTHYAFEIAKVQHTGHTAQANSHYIYVITPHYITSYVLFHLLLQCRTLGNATVRRQITVCTMTHCVMMSLDQNLWSNKQCNVSLLLAAVIQPSRKKEKGGVRQRATCVINGESVASPQPPVSERGRAAVPHHTGVLVPA